MDYQLISASTIPALEKAVKQALALGWKPLGGVCAWPGGAMLLQAMTR